MSNVKAKVKEFLASANKVAVATCINNAPSCRIMEVQKVEDDLTLWFVTHKSSPKVDHIQRGSEVCIVGHKEHTHMDIRLTGKCEVFTDMETKKFIWNEKMAPFFKEGINDPDLAVLKFLPKKAEYRDITTGSLYPEMEML
ncbi:MAG: pyridoxamine 5'-phosphate oxidase family protein [Candidatus Kuenenia sp.]|nr:pyridoxamine 5'-phosphate oxidase family protein [Candidatus Kuenenia hertensis]